MPAKEVEALAVRFFRHVTAGELAPAMALMAEDAILVEPGDLPFGGTYRGRQGLTDFARKLPRSIQIAADLTAVHATDEVAVLSMSLTFRCRKTGGTVGTDVVELYRISDGEIARVDVFYRDMVAVRELLEATVA